MQSNLFLTQALFPQILSQKPSQGFKPMLLRLSWVRHPALNSPDHKSTPASSDEAGSIWSSSYHNIHKRPSTARCETVSVKCWVSFVEVCSLHLYPARLFHAPTRMTSSRCFMPHRTIHALWNLYGNPYKNRAEKEQETRHMIRESLSSPTSIYIIVGFSFCFRWALV